jgi:dTDP-4-dehydrorhamnose reductase
VTSARKTILLTGKNGQVGWELQRALAPLGRVVALGSGELDLADGEAIRRAVRETRPAVIVNAAAYTAVDQAESEAALAHAVNGAAPRILAEEAASCGALLVHYSTDYVFDGKKADPYVESDPCAPLGVYGASKLAGEQGIQASACKHLIFRTSWVYGSRGKNFLLTMQRLSRERETLRVVADQFGAPTWSRLIAEASAQVLAQIDAHPTPEGLWGLYHLTCAGRTSWHGFTQAILDLAPPPRPPRLEAIPTAAYPLPAKRPANSVLSNDKLQRAFGLALPGWHAALALCLDASG